jgi:4-amino-4-deoxychorismate lyase
MSEPIAFVTNGETVPLTAAAGRGFQYGDGVFRTILKHNRRIVDLEPQSLRLRDDASRLGLRIEEVQLARLRDEATAVAASMDTAVIKLMLTRRDSGRAYRPAGGEVDRHVMLHIAPQYPREYWSDGIVAAMSDTIVAQQSTLAGVKHLNRLEQVLAYQDAPAGAEEVILCDSGGHVICGGRSNLFCVVDNVLMTPDLAHGGVRGFMRDQVLRLADQLGIETRVAPLPRHRFAAADEVFMTNSLIGIWPIKRIDSRRWPPPGAITKRLAQALAHPELS